MIVMELLVAPVRPVLAASIEPLPGVVMIARSLQVATPATALFDKELVDTKLPQVAPPFFERVIGATLSEQTVFAEFSTATETVPRLAPSTALEG
jgi:hypothetical protein